MPRKPLPPAVLWYVYTHPGQRFLGSLLARDAGEALRRAREVWVEGGLCVSREAPD